MGNKKNLILFVVILSSLTILALFILFMAGTPKELEPKPTMAPSTN